MENKQTEGTLQEQTGDSQKSTKEKIDERSARWMKVKKEIEAIFIENNLTYDEAVSFTFKLYQSHQSLGKLLLNTLSFQDVLRN